MSDAKNNTGYRNTGDWNTGDWNTGDWNTGNRNTGYWNTGNWNTGDRNTGNRNTGNRNTGYRNTGDWNTGNWNTGNWNTGYRNTGDWNTGDWNTGDWNTGNWNTGNRNTGYRNTGNWNTGNWNTGNWNTGNWNTGYWNTGYFNTTTPEMVQVFDGAMVKRDVFLSACPAWLYEPTPTTWVSETEMSDREKIDNPTFHTCGGYLRENDWGAEWARAFASASVEDVQRVRDLPGFDVEVFKAITGLDLSVPTKPDNPREITIDGAVYVLKGAS